MDQWSKLKPVCGSFAGCSVVPFLKKDVGVLLLLSEYVLLAVRTKSETAVSADSDLQKSVTLSKSRRPVTEFGNQAEILLPRRLQVVPEFPVTVPGNESLCNRCQKKLRALCPALL